LIKEEQMIQMYAYGSANSDEVDDNTSPTRIPMNLNLNAIQRKEIEYDSRSARLERAQYDKKEK
jgi:hypothetical protein